MNNIVRTWEGKAGEIELTDAQLGAVYGACDEEEEHRPECEEEKRFRECRKEEEEKCCQSVVIIFKSLSRQKCFEEERQECNFKRGW